MIESGGAGNVDVGPQHGHADTAKEEGSIEGLDQGGLGLARVEDVDLRRRGGGREGGE